MAQTLVERAIVATILAVAGSLYLLTVRPSVGPPTTTASPAITPTTFTSARYGYSIALPSSLVSHAATAPWPGNVGYPPCPSTGPILDVLSSPGGACNSSVVASTGGRMYVLTATCRFIGCTPRASEVAAAVLAATTFTPNSSNDDVPVSSTSP